jgi:CRP-like cAMP-binding protein
MHATWGEGNTRGLRHCPLFEGISFDDIGIEEFEGLRAAAVPVRLKAQERLLPGAEGPASVWLIEAGLLSLTYGDAEGRDATVLMLGPGDLLGDLQEGVGAEYGQNVVALRPALLYRLNQDHLEALFSAYPQLAYRVAQFSWSRIARLQQRLAEIMTKPVRQRLATLLLKTAEAYGEDGGDGSRSLGLSITHDDLARLVGSSREMVSKVMGQFRTSGWVRSARKTVALLDREALQHVAHPTTGRATPRRNW